MNARPFQFLLLATALTVLTGCATKETAANKPAMRALGQAAKPEEGASDEAIGTEIRRRLEIANAAMTASVIVEVNAGVVTLQGSAPTLQDAWRAEAAASAVPGVREVRNEIIARQ